MRVIAVDFDDTITMKNLSEPYDPLVKALVRARNCPDREGRAVIIVHTARSKADYAFVHSWLNYHEVPFDAIACEKLKADIYIDSKAVTMDQFTDIYPPQAPPKEEER